MKLVDGPPGDVKGGEGFTDFLISGSADIKEFLKIFESLGDGVTILDREGRIVHQISAGKKPGPTDVNDNIGKFFLDIYKDTPYFAEEREIWEATKNGGTSRTLQRIAENGDKYWISLKTTQIRDNNDEIVGYIGITRDVTEIEKDMQEMQGEIVTLEKNLEKEMVELSRRFDHIKILQDLGRRMVTSIVEDEIAGDAATVLVETMGYAAAGIVVLSEIDGKKNFQLIGNHAKIAPGKYGRKINSKPIIRAMKQRRPLIERYPSGVLSIGIMAKSELVIPLIQKDNQFGALIIAGQEEDRFSEEDVSLAGTVADLVALSLANCHSSRQMQDRELALNLLDDLTLQTISTRSVPEILGMTASRINKILETQACLIGMLEPDRGIEWMSIDGAEEFSRELRAGRFDDERIKEIAMKGDVFFTNNFLSDPSPIFREGVTLLVNNIMICPIQLGNETIGIIVLINRTAPSGFTDGNAALVWNFSDHLAVLINNARTMSSLDYSLRIRNLLLKTTYELQGAAGASDIYQKLGDMLLELIPYDSARFYSIGETGMTATLSRNLSEKLNLGIVEDSILDLVAKAISERKSNVNYFAPDREKLQEGASIMVLPLIGRQDEVGAIAIARAAQNEFSEQDYEIAALFANHAAISLENTALLVKEKEMLRESSQKIKQLESILDLTASVMSVERQEEAVKKVLWAITSVLGFSKGLILISQDKDGDYICLHSTGFAQSDSTRLSCMKIPSGNIVCIIDGQGKLIGKRTIALNPDSATDDDANDVMTNLGLDSSGEKYAITIEDSMGEIVGLILLGGATGKAHRTRGMIDLLEIYGNLASIAINNARLFDKEIAARAEIETLNDLMTHDINNFIQGVLGYLDIISADENVGFKHRTYAERAIQQVENTKRLIENVRKLALIKAEGAPKMQVIDLGIAIGEAIENVRANFPGKEIEFVSSIDRDSYFSLGDEMITELFINLFSNCVKFTATSDVPIELMIKPCTEFGKDHWRIEVVDHGRGIPDDRKQFVFERFGKQDYTPYGFGLGLSIVRSLTRKYGGRVWVENRVAGDYRQGSRFILILPRKDVEKEDKRIGEAKEEEESELAQEEKKKLVRKVKEKGSRGSSFSRVLKRPRQDRNEGEKAS